MRLSGWIPQDFAESGLMAPSQNDDSLTAKYETFERLHQEMESVEGTEKPTSQTQFMSGCGRMAGRMRQGHEHLLRSATILAPIVLDYGLLALETVLVTHCRSKVHLAVCLCFFGSSMSVCSISSKTPV